MTLIPSFITEIQKIHATGQATEHSYRFAFQALFSDLGVTALNEPKRVKCGAPDFIISDGDIVIGHVEAKDLPVSIRDLKGGNKDQQERYRAALPNLIYTNGLDWDFYRDGDLVVAVTIAKVTKGIAPNPGQFDTLEHLLRDFIAQKPQTITEPSDLAERMAGKAILVKDVIGKALTDDDALESELTSQYEAFKDNLIRDIKPEDFADIYAETVAYGMFAARLHDATPDTFSRREALELLPKSNPFLRSLFTYIAGYDLDERISWIIDDLARVFQACDVARLMENFGKLTGQNDPFLHFYETFLAAYNPSKRKARGVWYTPEPVVNFIVRAVDEVLQSEFGLADGLADTSKVTIDWDTGERAVTRRGKVRKDRTNFVTKCEVHRVQILDPATGTGTFLAEVIKQIAPKVQGIAPSMWSSYIEQDLIPRLHGLELLMASYAMCHMKLDMILTELGYKPTGSPTRLSVFLTNSLEKGEPANTTLPFARWISQEADGANKIKRDMPIMCVIGNPPYSGISENMGEWIKQLIEDYKYVDGQHFGEKKHWLQDDYVKFIRLSESLIKRNGEGVLGFITNHGYLDNPTFRGMRWHLLTTFDRIQVLDLHGNAKKKEVTPDGKPDKNVFDIQQGVAIIIAAKTGRKGKELAEVWHGDLWGTRESKYTALTKGRPQNLIAEKIACSTPQYAFVRRDHTFADVYGQGFLLVNFMPNKKAGIVTARDGLVIDFTGQVLKDKINRFVDPSKTDDQIRAEFFPKKKAGKYLPGDSRGFELGTARAALLGKDWAVDIKEIVYRPFDTRAILYRPDMVDWGRFGFMSHMMQPENFGLVFNRTVEQKRPYTDVFVFSGAVQHHSLSLKEVNYVAPLYLYPKDEHDVEQERRVNFDPKAYERLQELATHPLFGKPDEVAVFDYIYGVLHCPAYRETYAEFLKIDFPRIPWPSSPEAFWDVSTKGTELRRLHLMEPDAIGETPFPFEGLEGDNVVNAPTFQDCKVWINAAQYFDNVPEVSWGLFIGGYQPAQKWLKDRKGRTLSFRDVKHYQRILKILSETDRIMAFQLATLV